MVIKNLLRLRCCGIDRKSPAPVLLGKRQLRGFPTGCFNRHRGPDHLLGPPEPKVPPRCSARAEKGSLIRGDRTTAGHGVIEAPLTHALAEPEPTAVVAGSCITAQRHFCTLWFQVDTAHWEIER